MNARGTATILSAGGGGAGGGAVAAAAAGRAAVVAAEAAEAAAMALQAFLVARDNMASTAGPAESVGRAGRVGRWRRRRGVRDLRLRQSDCRRHLANSWPRGPTATRDSRERQAQPEALRSRTVSPIQSPRLKVVPTIPRRQPALGFIRRKRAPGLKKADMLIPIGVVFNGSKPAGGQHVHQSVVSPLRYSWLPVHPH